MVLAEKDYECEGYTALYAVKYHNVSTLMTILRCPRAHYKAVWSALSGITTFKKEPCSLSVVHLAGTIRSVQQALVQRNLALLKKELAMTTLPGKLSSYSMTHLLIAWIAVEREKIERKWREIKKSLQDLARW